MAVYTQVPAETLSEFLKRYDVGTLQAAKGIAEGVENSNYLVDTTGADGQGARFILTLYEKRVDASDLPYFMALLDHLAGKSLPVPPAIKDREGREIQELEGRPACLIRFLPGVSLSHPTPAQARAAGRSMAQMHAAVADFTPTRANSMGAQTWGSPCSSAAAGASTTSRPVFTTISASPSETYSPPGTRTNSTIARSTPTCSRTMC